MTNGSWHLLEAQSVTLIQHFGSWATNQGEVIVTVPRARIEAMGQFISMFCNIQSAIEYSLISFLI